MKKFLCGLMILSLLMTVMLPALAAGVPTVSFKSQTGAVNGGNPYEAVLRVSSAPENDLAVRVKNGQTGEVLCVTIPAGEKEAALMIPTAAVETRAKANLTIEPDDAYNAGGKCTLSLYPMPRVTFTSKVNVGALGRRMSVPVRCANPSALLKGGNTVQLRGVNGVVLAEKKWPLGEKETNFSFEVTQELLGRQDLTLWLGDTCITAETGYAVLGDTSRKVIQELQPEVPVMAIGIDCAYEDTKTDLFLEVLEKHDVKVTFFMTGYFMREFPEAAKKIAEAGHEIATHSNTHERMKNMGAYNQYRQVMRPVEEAEGLMGVTPRLFRPPFGEFTSQITTIARAEGLEMIMWTIDYKDSFLDYTREDVKEEATTGYDYHPGTIVLGHLDGRGMPDALDAGLTHYESLGLKTVPVSALIYLSGGELPPMPEAREALVYTDDYWPQWIRENVPEYAYVLDK